MNLPLKPVGGVCGEAGGVGIGVPQGAPPATFLAEDAMAQSIVNISRELEEAQAQMAVYEEERSILQRERDNWRAAAAKATADRDRNKREWDKCAAELAAVLNGFDEMDAADAEAESMEAAE